MNDKWLFFPGLSVVLSNASNIPSSNGNSITESRCNNTPYYLTDSKSSPVTTGCSPSHSTSGAMSNTTTSISNTMNSIAWPGVDTIMESYKKYQQGKLQEI